MCWKALNFPRPLLFNAVSLWSFVNMGSRPEEAEHCRRTAVEVILLELRFCKNRILFTDKCAGREKKPGNSIWMFLFLQTVAGYALRASVTVSSHIQILVLRLKATKTLLSVCGAASSDRNINPPIPPSSSSSKPLKKRSFIWRRMTKTFLHAAHNRWNGFMWHKHSSLPPKEKQSRHGGLWAKSSL